MKIVRALAVAAAAVSLAACAVPGTQLAHSDFRPPSGSYRVIVMQPDISVGVLTAGGLVEHREDWTEQARGHVLQALRDQQARRGGDITIASTRDQAGGDAAIVADLYWLHTAVGQAIQTHKYGGMTLPTKKDKFDWTLGSEAVAYGEQTQFDYALFLRASDSFSSGGRVALQVAGAIACGFGVCVMPPGGMQQAFASLVDLKTGQVVWFNTHLDTVGDIRTPEGAKLMVDKLLDTMRSGQELKPART